MSEDRLELADPAVELEAAYLAMIDDFAAAGEPYHQHERAEVEMDFPGFVRKLRDWSRGVNLRPDCVASTTYWLVRGRTVLGTSRLRHSLCDRLLHEGGHVGYDVRPSERGRGYATRLLALTLAKARERGIVRALVTCDADNAASARVIRKNGGALEDERISLRTGKPIRRYWIDLALPERETSHG